MSAEYELILMLDPEVPDERREEIASNARERIEASGNLRHGDSWGTRKMAYEIEQRTEADYRFFRFEAEPALLDDLDHTLKITDGILRFRVFKVDPEAPIIEPPAATPLAAPRPRRDDRGRGRGRDDDSGDGDAPAAQAEAPPAQPSETAAEPAAAEPPAAEPAPTEPTASDAVADAAPAEPAPAEPAAAEPEAAEPAPAEKS